MRSRRKGEDVARWALFCEDAEEGRLGVRYDQLFALALAVLGES